MFDVRLVKNSNKIFYIFFCLFVLGAAAKAQVPDPKFQRQTDTIFRQEQELEKRKDLPTEIPKSLIKKKEDKKTSGTGASISVKEFKFEGEIKAVSLETLNDLVKEFVGKSLSFEELQSVVKIVNDYYKDKGYFLANAVLPKQEVKNGTVIIFINEGKLDSKEPYKINKENLRIPEDRVKAYVDDAFKDGLTQQSLERALLNLNDNPGVSSTANVEAGSEPGTSRILIDITEAPLFTGSATIDNYGSRYTGDFRGTLSLNLNNPSTYGDVLNVTEVKGYQSDFTSKKVSYEFPIGVSGLRAGASYNELNYGLFKELLTDPKSTGKGESYNANVKYPIFRSGLNSLMVSANYDKKKSVSTATGITTSDKVLDNYNAGLTYQNTDQLFGGGFTQLSGVVTKGKLDLSKSSSSLTDDQDVDGAKTNGNFTKENFQILRIQRGTERLSFQFLADAQIANKNLDSSEKFSLGGPTGVRAYPGGEGSGDEGYKVSLDAKYSLITGSDFGDVLGSVFYDYGKVRQFKDTGMIAMTTPNHFALSGWGVGLDLVASGKYSVKVGWAHVLGGNSGSSTGLDGDGRNESSRYWLLATTSF